MGSVPNESGQVLHTSANKMQHGRQSKGGANGAASDAAGRLRSGFLRAKREENIQSWACGPSQLPSVLQIS